MPQLPSSTATRQKTRQGRRHLEAVNLTLSHHNCLVLASKVDGYLQVYIPRSAMMLDDASLGGLVTA